MTTIGGQDRNTCSGDDAGLVEWIYNGEVVAQGFQQAALDILLVNDSIHGHLYTCSTRILKLNLTIIVNGENMS